MSSAALRAAVRRGGPRRLPEPTVQCARTDGTVIRPVAGNRDPKHVSTGYVERQNLNLRMGVRCFARLTNAFSKRLQNHVHPLAILWPVMSMATRSGTPARVRLRANRPGFVGGPCSLRRKDSGAVLGPHCPPLPNQSGNPHQEEIRDQAIEQDPRRAEQPPTRLPATATGVARIVAPSSNVRNRPVVPRRRRSTTQPMTQPVTKNRPSPIHISGFTNCSQAVVSPKR